MRSRFRECKGRRPQLAAGSLRPAFRNTFKQSLAIDRVLAEAFEMDVTDMTAARGVGTEPRPEDGFPVGLMNAADGFPDEMAASHGPDAIDRERSLARIAWPVAARMRPLVDGKEGINLAQPVGLLVRVVVADAFIRVDPEINLRGKLLA